jgi:hypothetical protein
MKIGEALKALLLIAFCVCATLGGKEDEDERQIAECLKVLMMSGLSHDEYGVSFSSLLYILNVR